MKKKSIYWATAVLCLLVAVYGVLLALDVSFLLVIQVSDTVGAPREPIVISNAPVATAIGTAMQLPVLVPEILGTVVPDLVLPDVLNSLPNLPDAMERLQPSIVDQILRSLGLTK